MEDALKVLRKQLTMYDLGSVAHAAGVCEKSLLNWVEGTYSPQYENLVKVAAVLGFEVNMTIKRTKNAQKQ